jgi:hypothetical protein
MAKAMNEKEKKLLKLLKNSPICHFDLNDENLKIILYLEKERLVEKFIDNGSCQYPMSTIHYRDSYYWRLKT